jgi:hypothetical protein
MTKTQNVVKITAVDCNFSLPIGGWFDGPPFDPMPEWLSEAWRNHVLFPHRYGFTDYAQWLVIEKDGKRVNLGPGDFIERLPDGSLQANPTQNRYSNDTDGVYEMLRADGFPSGYPND